MRQITANYVASALVGLSLALTLQTSYRMTPSIGFGELGLGLFILWVALVFFIKDRHKIRKKHKAILVLFGYVVLILLPLTAIHTIAGTEGSSFRDWLAYLLSALLVLAIAVAEVDTRMVVRSTIIFVLLFVGLQFLFGGEEAWYSARFTGGANNPNQLGLYIVCCMLLVTIADFKKHITALLLVVAIFFGLRTLSDAFLAYMAAVVFLIFASSVAPKKYFPYVIVIFTLPLVVVGLGVIVEYSDSISNIWTAADEGGERSTLLVNGVEAWLSNLSSIIIGNGAGSYSGLDGPFQMSESHNTPIDILTIGGVVGLFVFYYTVFKNSWIAYGMDKRLVFVGSVGLIVFSLFHFVARHPIFWFTVFAVSEYLWHQRHRSLK